MILCKPSQVTALILAGGQSSRMGRDKALISVEGVPLIRRVYDAADRCVDSVCVVTPWPGRYQFVLPAECQFIQEVPAPEGGSAGPLVGFVQGLGQAATDWVLLLACDLPRLRAEVLQAAIATLPHASPDTVAVLPRSEKGWEPLCGFYHRRCFSELIAFVAQGGRSFQSWLEGRSVMELVLADASVLFNCNTPNDLESLGPWMLNL
jgi:molybdopterin-guanine dinucleotide biosynthesis protein A